MIKLSCPEFNNGEYIPKKYTNDGENISPPLQFENIPAGTESLVLIIENPCQAKDKSPWIHWLVYNIPPHSCGFKENEVSEGSIEGFCNGDTIGYKGPRPSESKNLYIFKLYALDMLLPISSRSDTTSVMRMMNGHIIEKYEMIGFYKQ